MLKNKLVKDSKTYLKLKLTWFVTVFVIFLVMKANHIHRTCMNSIALYYLVSADTLPLVVLGTGTANIGV